MKRIPTGRNENCRTPNVWEGASISKLQTYITLLKKKLPSAHWPNNRIVDVFILHSCPLLHLPARQLMHIDISLAQWPL